MVFNCTACIALNFEKGKSDEEKMVIFLSAFDDIQSSGSL